MTKYILFSFVCFLMISKANSQETKEFLIPNPPHNKASFYAPNKAGAKTDMTRTIYFIKKGNSYELIDAQMFGNTPSSIIRRRIEFSENEAKMVSSVSTTFSETKKERIHNPAAVILKIPSKGQKASWTFKDISGDLINCNSFWTTENIDGKEIDAIKVEQQIEVLGNARKVETYVRGIGLWKTELKGSDGKIQIFEKFDQLGYDSNAK